uniref:Uncharacterized protein n=1 Tax=Rhizophora mucronata TaxID=61149 RepID=A0A2P2INS5_RHIMU
MLGLRTWQKHLCVQVVNEAVFSGHVDEMLWQNIVRGTLNVAWLLSTPLVLTFVQFLLISRHW